ncbi:unnamed protein product [Brassica oleracea var. botrytis]|uniref:(rape) hypothetical protein n=1 Tax=Brassica napus TaxID=3708 RepID=A0A816KVH2_BRANA|nr:unnamed protein product [Brassica napus]
MGKQDSLRSCSCSSAINTKASAYDNTYTKNKQVDSTSSKQDVSEFQSQFLSMDSFESKPLKGLKIGFIHEKLEEGVHSGMRSATKEAASHLEGLDCVLTEVNVNLAGLPAIVLPCGLVERGSSGLPVGLQMIGAAFDEEKLLKVSHIFEQTLKGSGFVSPTLPNVACT